MLPAIQALLSFGCLFLGGAALLLLSVLGAFHAARRATWKHVKALPGPDGSIPLLWIVRQHFRIARVKHMVPYNASAMETHLGICSQYRKKGFYRFYVGNQLHVMIFKPELIETVLTSQKTMSKSFNYSLLHSWLGTGLLTSSGAKWKQRRRMLTPAFHFRILEDFVAPMNEHARNMGKRISQFSESDETDVVPFLAACTLEILLETIMGVTTGKYREDIGSYIDAIKYLTEQVVARSNTPWLQLDSIYLRTDAGLEYKRRVSVVHDFTKKVIANRREELVRETRTVHAVSTNDDEFREKRRLTFIDILLHHSLDFDALLKDEDIREEVDTFMFEGHDTTTMAVAWCLYLIGLHRQVQMKVQEELDDVLGGEPDRNITPEDMKKLKYMDCVIKESQRLCPSVPLIGRTATEELKLGGHTIPEGTNIGLILYVLHRDPDAFPRPEEFDPDRFLPENSASRHPFAFIPFSAGSRNCIGQKFASMEIKIILGHVLRSFNLQSVHPRDKLLMTVDTVLRTANGLKIKFIPRVS
ncbi:cytochrome P450 4V2 [Ixodes scapularis]|uniref:cytochrome P450 4V2 n=1 Tax=Ixodes scapularis TaxID=6945 RepID=UPI001C3895D2|nr:cytochrome P450 4V2 [Ixodes scapularis]